MVADVSVGVDEVVGRPIFVLKRLPNRIITVDCNRIRDFEILYGLPYVGKILLKSELRCVNADNDETGSSIFLPPRLHVGNRSRSEEHTSELQSHVNLVCRLLLEK